MVTSQNGYSANDESVIGPYTVGNSRVVRLRKGDTGFLLKDLADWFDKNIEDVDQGADDWGYAARTIRGDATTLSNHASGTALDLNATKHPLGVRGTFSSAKTSAIRQHLKVYEGAIRWGGDYVNRPDEMHFEINADAATVKRVAAKIRAARKAALLPKTPTSPLAHQHVVNTWNDSREVSLHDVSAVQLTGKQPYAAAANTLHDAIQAAVQAYYKATGVK